MKRHRQNSTTLPEVALKHFKNGPPDDYSFLQTPSPIKVEDDEMVPYRSSEGGTNSSTTFVASELMSDRYRLEHIWNLFNVISGRLINLESENPERLIRYHRVSFFCKTLRLYIGSNLTL